MARYAAGLTGLSAFLAFINPYNATHDLIFPIAFAYWFTLILVGGVTAELCMRFYEKRFSKGPILGMLAIGALTSAASVSAFMITAEHFVGDGIPLAYWPTVYGPVLVIAVAITALGYMFDRAFNPQPEASAEPPDTRFLQRLPVKFHTADLYALSSEDHYLRVHTNFGEELILMRLADAIRELAGADGLQVHRSWWVARDGIAEERRENGRSILVLKSGTDVPVSRSYRAAAKTANLIK